MPELQVEDDLLQIPTADTMAKYFLAFPSFSWVNCIGNVWMVYKWQ